MTTTIEYARKEIRAQKKVSEPGWQRITLLIVLGYEAAGCLLGGSLLVASPNGRYMDMPVDIMHGVFRDFLIPGIILFGLGILNAVAFVTVLRRTSSNWVMTGLALGGLAIWFWVEITILQEVHWLHFMWGLPVIVGGLVAIPVIPYRHSTMRKALFVCGIFSSLLYVAMNVFVAMQWEGYSSASQEVSELSAIGAPTRPLWVSLGMIYTLLVIAFGCGVWKSARSNRPLRVIGGLMFAYGVIGPFWLFLAPMHLREVLAAGGGTLSDTMHIAFTIVTVFLMLLAMGFGAAAFGKRFRFYSIATIVILLVFGSLTSLQAPQLQANLPTPWMGVWERISIGVFLLWVVMLAIVLLRTEKRQSLKGTSA